MKKIARRADVVVGRYPNSTVASRDSVWCSKYAYFIDLEACRARSYQRNTCRRCFKSLTQTVLPF